ncbi:MULTISPECIES: DegT/DnrJ/EryC1/StrS family aminotransferase [Bizionia]|uniref:DegT/DnrJ/EryC1/StrS family aminotransferase n=1 Tax=Bizionia algoritergicola TaxID=291187 RepID=A0A5D0QV57_9FLAO|nr:MULTISPECIES: DegT/DnrJ/EryC1/StrS family aminotransferase [Bizionia]OBX21376.1 aminotransferase DegT [Bizionia sp. APA-3]TYB72084.1 DegT/DnrJ/EryC1/StrS family aminotransferase [Bizionia algoritergicola]
MINVTQSFLPPIQEFEAILKRAWDKKWMTNRGELLLELESKLSTYLGVSNFFITTNGTLPLQIALKTLGITKEVITTPFSYVATTSAIIWENCTPVFVDIERDMLTIDPVKIEAAITENTEAILATHVFGNPCDVEAIQAIAEKYNLKVIYDAAHCFAVTYKGKSIFEYGDIISTSFHSTKLFHTGEGGAIFVPNDALYKKCYYHHNFGHNGPLEYHGLGINAKASEMQAAMGLSVLPYIDTIIAKRKLLTETYESLLKDNANVSLFGFREFAEKNYSYMPVIFKDEAFMQLVLEKLAALKIYPRRYFYPSLNKLPYLEKSVSMPISEDICSKILCLPLYFELEKQQVAEICNVINSL